MSSLQDGINYLRDSMAALGWMAWEEKGHYSRADLNFDQERQSFRQDIEDYPPPDWEYEQRIIFRPNKYFQTSSSDTHFSLTIR